MASAYRDLLARQAEEVSALARTESKRALAFYKSARADLMQRLEFLESSAAPQAFGVRHYQLAIHQIDQSIAGLESALKRGGKKAIGAAAELAQEHLREQFAYAKSLFGGAAAEFAAGEAVPAVEQVATILAPQVEAGVERVGTDLVAGMQRRLAAGMLAGDTTAEARDRIFSEFFQPIGVARAGKEQLPITAHWIDRLTQTQTAAAYNVNVGELARTGAKGKVEKVWVSELAPTTCQRCADMDGEAVDIGDTFDFDGDEIYSPPAHPNCLCTLAVNVEGFDDTEQQADTGDSED